jgi:phosphatidylglycerophosphate synthase
MDMHRAGKKADWVTVPRRRWNVWQQVAANSGGLLTMGNVLTLAGFALVAVGLSMAVIELYWPAFGFIAVGRLCDVLDGWAANATKTKSPLGEFLDSTADKLETALALVILLLIGLLPWLAALLIFVPQAAIALVSLIALRYGRRIHPSRLGKLSMAAAWAGLGVFILVAAAGWSNMAVVTWLAYVLSGLAAALASAALIAYSQQLR